MNKLTISLMVFLFGITAMATPTEITCSYQWKNTNAAPGKFSFKVNALGTSKAKFVVSMNKDDEMNQVIKVLKSSEHEADVMLREVGMDHSGEIFTSAKDDVKIQIGDAVSTVIFIQLYKNSKYTAGYMTVHCDESYCGKFDYYSTLSCK